MLVPKPDTALCLTRSAGSGVWCVWEQSVAELRLIPAPRLDRESALKMISTSVWWHAGAMLWWYDGAMCDPAEENPTCDPRPCSSRGPAARCAMGPGDAPRLGGGSKPVRGTGSGGAVLQRPGPGAGLLACVKCCQGPSPVRRGRCLRQHCTPAWHRHRGLTWRHQHQPQPRPGKPRKLVLSGRSENRDQLRRDRGPGSSSAPCSVSSVHSPHCPQQSSCQWVTLATTAAAQAPVIRAAWHSLTQLWQCQHSVLTPDTDWHRPRPSSVIPSNKKRQRSCSWGPSVAKLRPRGATINIATRSCVPRRDRGEWDPVSSDRIDVWVISW